MTTGRRAEETLSVTTPTQVNRRYRLEIIRKDGSRANVLGDLTFEEAQRSQEAIREADIFVDVQIVIADESRSN